MRQKLWTYVVKVFRRNYLKSIHGFAPPLKVTQTYLTPHNLLVNPYDTITTI